MTRDLVDLMGGPRGREPERLSDDNQSKKSDLSDFDMAFHYETPQAILVSETGDESKAVWLPKNNIEFVKTNKAVPGTRKNGEKANWIIATVTVPQWLAIEKGLV